MKISKKTQQELVLRNNFLLPLIFGALFIIIGIACILTFFTVTKATCSRTKGSISCDITKTFFGLDIGQTSVHGVQKAILGKRVRYDRKTRRLMYRIEFVTKDKKVPLTNAYTSYSGNQKLHYRFLKWQRTPSQKSVTIVDQYDSILFYLLFLLPIIGLGTLMLMQIVTISFHRGNGRVTVVERGLILSDKRDTNIDEIQQAMLLEVTEGGSTSRHLTLQLRGEREFMLSKFMEESEGTLLATTINQFLQGELT